MCLHRIILGSFVFSLSRVYALPAPIGNENLLTERDNISDNAFHFTGFEGCNLVANPSWSTVIEDAWDSLLDIGNAVNNNVKFDGDAEQAFLGAKDKNTDYQQNIQKILYNIVTWTKGSFLSWTIHARCDDFLHLSVDPSSDCPTNTLKDDWSKCNSRCWKSFQDANNNPVWSTSALAYTQNVRDTITPVATINFCPGFFDTQTCQAGIDKWGSSTVAATRLDLINYLCQGYVMVHELMHIDYNSARMSPETGHVYDRAIRVVIPGGGMQKLLAYGPLYTKTLANWAGTKVGYYVATNADNLALYSLAKWVTGKIGAYPYYPSVTEVPAQDPGITDPRYAVVQDNGTIYLSTDTTVVGDDLHVAAAQAYDTYLATQYSCSDASTDDACNNESTNPGIALMPDGTTPQDTSSTATAVPSPTSAPSSAPVRSLTCNGLGSKKYISQGDLATNIQNYCTQAIAQGVQDSGSGSITRSFNQGTMEEISLTMTWPSGSTFKPDGDCNYYMNLISSNCDGDSPTNPMNWKGGGSIQLDSVQYQITPVTLRQAVPTAPGGAIQCTGLHFWLNGNGWSGGDNGSCLENWFNGCLGSGYSFNYGLGDDGREWTMVGWLGPGQGSCGHNAIQTCGGPSIDFCS